MERITELSVQKDSAISGGISTIDKPHNIKQAISHIEENLFCPLGLEGLAQTANLSKFHFCRTFKRYIGMNPMKFVASLRIERAKEMLEVNDLTVSAVAEGVGFRDLTNFIRQFKKITGMTPTTYRETIRGRHDTGDTGNAAAAS